MPVFDQIGYRYTMPADATWFPLLQELVSSHVSARDGTTIPLCFIASIKFILLSTITATRPALEMPAIAITLIMYLY